VGTGGNGSLKVVEDEVKWRYSSSLMQMTCLERKKNHIEILSREDERTKTYHNHCDSAESS
jgi:hypothetical protein